MRVEEDGDETPQRIYDKNGNEIKLPSDEELRQLKSPAWPGQPTLPSMPQLNMPRPTTFGRDWIDTFVAKPDRNSSRHAALERAYGRASGKVRGLDRFVKTDGTSTHELLSDPTSSVPVEFNSATNGELQSHYTISYAQDTDGSLIRRSMHAEQRVGREGQRAVTDVGFSNTRFERRR